MFKHLSNDKNSACANFHLFLSTAHAQTAKISIMCVSIIKRILSWCDSPQCPNYVQFIQGNSSSPSTLSRKVNCYARPALISLKVFCLLYFARKGQGSTTQLQNIRYLNQRSNGNIIQLKIRKGALNFNQKSCVREYSARLSWWCVLRDSICNAEDQDYTVGTRAFSRNKRRRNFSILNERTTRGWENCVT